MHQHRHLVLIMTNKNLFLLAISFLSVIAIILLPPIAQDLNYHQFADQRTLLGIPNFFNVISNVPYLIAGLAGCFLILKQSTLSIVSSIKNSYTLFFVSVSLVCIGSSYYHLTPSNHTLIWDRLPMTLAFMSFITVIIGEYIHEKTARALFVPLLITGIFSALYWYWSETINQGDLRLYILIQFLPIIIIPIILRIYTPKFTHNNYFWLIIACYALAKLFEITDQLVFDTIKILSGHSIKHLISAAAPYLFYLALKKRKIY